MLTLARGLGCGRDSAQDDYSRLEADIQQKQTTYDNLCRQVAKYEQELQNEPNKQR